MISSEDNALSQIVEIDVAIDSVISGNFVLGEYHYSLLVKGETPDQTREFRSNASQLLNNANFLGVDLEKVTASAYAAQLPCNWKSRPREARISSRNFTGVCSFHTFDSGKRNGNPWGEAVTLFRTPAGARSTSISMTHLSALIQPEIRLLAIVRSSVNRVGAKLSWHCS